jgi:glycosyltransferase involved in cell wall biosynthesis
MDTSPKISVLLPVGNRHPFLSEALDSLVAREGVDFEVVLVDNTTQRRFAIGPDELSPGISRLKIVHEPLAGIAHALNTGLRHCRGRYIARMDADDICLPGRLKIQSEYLDQHPGSGMVSGLVDLFGHEEHNQGMKSYVERINHWISEQDLFNHRFVESPFAHPSVMFRRSLIENHGPYSTGPIPEDYELWLRWFALGIRMAKIPQKVIRWRDHPDRLSRTDRNYSLQAFDTVRLKYLVDWLHERKNLPPVWIWGGGKYSRKKAAQLTLAGIPVRGFIDVHPNRKIAGFEVIHYTRIPPPGTAFVISMVSNRDKYREIEQWLTGINYVRGKDYLLAS